MVFLEFALLMCGRKNLKPILWGSVLLLVALLQQSSVEVRNQLMQQRGSLLLQLLYHVLGQDSGLGGQGFDGGGSARFGVLVGDAGQAFRRKVAEHQEHRGRDACSAEEMIELLAGEESNLAPHEVVLMALQSLVYDLIEIPAGSREELGTIMTMTRGEGTCFSIFAVCLCKISDVIMILIVLRLMFFSPGSLCTNRWRPCWEPCQKGTCWQSTVCSGPC
jgi:hypothetical protein